MFAALLRVQVSSVLASLGSSMRRKSGGLDRSGVYFLVGFMALLFLFIFGWTFSALAEPFYAAGLGWFYFALALLCSFALGFIGSVFTAQNQLFAARDNELLLAMPIPPRLILGSRMAMLLVMNYALQAAVLLPAGLIWLIKAQWSLAGAAAFCLGALFMPLLTLCLTCLAAWLLALLTSRLRNKSLITTVFYIIFLCAYFYFYFRFQNLLSVLVENGARLAGGLKAVYPVYAFGVAAAQGDPACLLGFLACCALPFAAVYALISRSFTSIATRRTAARRAAFREGRLRSAGVGAALFKKELARFGANGMYILNASTGAIMTLIGAAALVIYRGSLAAFLGLLPEGTAAALACLALCFLAAMNLITAPSISLEGKTLWLLKSLPVPAHRLLFAKAALHMAVAAPPSLIGSVVCCACLPLSAPEAAAVVLLPALMNLFGALLGLSVNLRWPKFDYINETAVIKNSASVAITMFASWAVLAAPAILYGAALHRVMPAYLFLLVCAAALAAACAALASGLRRRGGELLLEL